eukprot:scaffold20693_cov76-Phaeocystis_antarctica.AAC.2
MAQSAGAGIVKPVASSSWLITLIVAARSPARTSGPRYTCPERSRSRTPRLAARMGGLRRLCLRGLRVGCARVTSDGAGGGKAHARDRRTSRVLSWRTSRVLLTATEEMRRILSKLSARLEIVNSASRRIATT